MSLSSVFSRIIPQEARVCITTHVNADPDAAASAYLAKKLLESICGEKIIRTDIIFPEGPSKFTRKILENLGINSYYRDIPSETAYDLIVVVDAASSEQMGCAKKLLDSSLPIVLIDHHTSGGDLSIRAKYALVEPEVATTVILVVELMKLNVRISKSEASLALSGILFDTKRFTIASPNAFRASAWLIEQGANYAHISKLTQQQEGLPFSERIARLKAAQRLSIIRYGEFIVVLSNVGSYEASAARALLSLGADVAIVAGGKKGEFRVCARATPRFYEKTGISLGSELMRLLEKRVSGRGGGHDLVAGFNGRGDPARVLNVAGRLLLELISSRLRERSVGRP